MGIDNQLVGRTVTRLRQRRNMTQQQLAAVLNVSHQAVSKWENGAALPDIQTLLSLAQLFGVTMEQLLSGDIPGAEEEEAEPEEPSLGKWLRDAIPEEARSAIKSTAKGMAQAASDIAQKVGNVIGLVMEDADDGACESSAEDVSEDESDSRSEEDIQTNEFSCLNVEPADEKAADNDAQEERPETADSEDMTFRQLLSLAPFMSRQKLDEIALSLKDEQNWSELVKLAPFLSRATLGKLASRMTGTPVERDVLRRLAPFMSSDDLFELLAGNLKDFSVSDLKDFAPFLRRGMVDDLFTYATTGHMPERGGCEKTETDLGDLLHQTMNGIGNVVNGIGSTVNSAIENLCGKDKPKAPAEQEKPAVENAKPVRMPSEFKDKVARAALIAGNWAWLDAHLTEIGNRNLLLDVAVHALESPEHAETAARVAPLIGSELLPHLLQEAMNRSAWEFLEKIRDLITEENADAIVQAACADTANQACAYSLIQSLAPKISRELLESMTENAIREDNWALINALTEAF